MREQVGLQCGLLWTLAFELRRDRLVGFALFLMFWTLFNCGLHFISATTSFDQNTYHKSYFRVQGSAFQ